MNGRSIIQPGSERGFETATVASRASIAALATNGDGELQIAAPTSGEAILEDRGLVSATPISPTAGSTVSNSTVDGTPRSVRKSVADVKREGWLYRESTVLDGVVNLRFAAILPYAVVSFRDPDDDAPTKVWPLDKDCQLSPVQQSEFSIRKRKRNLVIAFATRHFHRKQLSWFSLKWPKDHIYAQEPLRLCFKEAAEAVAWRDTTVATVAAIGASTTALLPVRQPAVHRRGSSFGRLRRQFTPGHAKKTRHREMVGRGSTASEPTTPILAVLADHFHAGSLTSLPRSADGGFDESGSGSVLPALQQSMPPTNGVSGCATNSGSTLSEAVLAQQAAGFPATPPVQLPRPGSNATEAATREDGNTAPAAAPSNSSFNAREGRRKWASFRHVCGVAIYQEEEEERGEEGGATMVSTCIRSSPETAFQALMDMENSTNFMAPFLSAVKLEDRSPHTRVIKGWLHSRGWPSRICAPREAVVEQHWRQEEDGTFIVFMHSVRHHAARETPPSPFSWYHPIRAEIVACTYSIAPLQPELAGAAQECLLTMVLKARLGGWLGVGLPANPSRLSQLAAPFMDMLHGSYLEPLLLSVITLRDSVEQDRFTVKPFSLRHSMAVTDLVLPVFPPPTHRRSSQPLPEGHFVAPIATHVLRNTSLLSGADQTGGSDNSDLQQMNSKLGSSTMAAHSDDTTPTLVHSMWSYPGSSDFKLRGKKYLSGDKKKTAAGEPMFELAACDLTESDELMWNVGRFLPSIRNSSAPFTFVVNFMVPGPPFRNLVMSWSAPEAPAGWGIGDASLSSDFSSSPPLTPQGLSSIKTSEVHPAPPSSSTGSYGSGADGNSSDSSCPVNKRHSRSGPSVAMDYSESEGVDPFDICFARFLEGNGYEAARRRNARFKLIPHIIKSSWVVKGAVGSTPVLLGNKLLTKYFKGERYFEVDVDISSSLAASGIVNIVKGATKSMVIDFAVVIEGQSEQELPERLLGTCRFSHLDMDSGMFLDHDGKLHPRDAKGSHNMRPGVRQPSRPEGA